MPSRRTLLTGLGAAAAAGVGGCIGRVRSAFDDEPPVTGPCDDADATWPTAGGDRGRTGRTDVDPPAPDVDAVDLLAGVRDDGGRRLASTLPAVGDGTAYVPSGGGVAAVDLDEPTAEPRWFRDLDDDVDAVPALACGAVLAAGLNETVALDPATGEERWRADVGGHGETTVATSGETAVVAGPRPVALEVRTGSETWRASGGDTVAIGSRGVYTTRNANGVGDAYAHDLKGEERWHLALGKIVGSASVLDGTVWVADNRGSVYAIDGTTGETLWSRSLDGVQKVHTGLAVGGGDVVVPAGTGDRSVVLDAETGETRWVVDSGIVTGRPLIGDDWVALGRTNVGVTVYDRATGEPRASWTRDEYDLGTVDGIVPVEEGFLVRGGTTSGLTLIR
jgi:outer membrane protein assembly factor BamB